MNRQPPYTLKPDDFAQMDASGNAYIGRYEIHEHNGKLSAYPYRSMYPVLQIPCRCHGEACARLREIVGKLNELEANK